MKPDGEIIIETEVSTKSFDAQISQLEKKLNDVEATIEIGIGDGLDSKDMEELNVEAEKLRNKIFDLKKQQQKFNEEQEKNSGLAHIKEGMEGIGNTLEKNIKKVKKYVLAVFGIRSAYAGIKQAMSLVTANNEELSGSIQHMKEVLAYTIEPIIRRIVEWAQKLMQYVGYIIQAWTGKNLFGDAEKNLKKSKKSAQDLKKQLAGFDEVNVLSSNSSSSGGSADMSMFQDLQNMEVPGWIDWIAQNKDIVLGFLEALGILITALKLKDFVADVQDLWETLSKDPKFLQKIGGYALIISGIVIAVQSLIKYIKDPSWENFGGVLEGIGLLIAGIGLTIGSLPVIVAGVIVLILGLIASFWDKIEDTVNDFLTKFYKFGDDIMNWINDKLGWVGVIINTVIGTIIGVIGSMVETIKHLLGGIFTGFKQILDGIIQIFKGNFAEGFISIGKGIANIFIGIINACISGINAVVSPIRALVVAVGKVVGKNWTMDNIKIPTIPRLASGAIVNNPGVGVNMGSYIAGERGREGVIPLDNPNTMSELGQEIGRYCNINNIVDVNVDGRRLNRVMQQSDNNRRFASNGG